MEHHETAQQKQEEKSNLTTYILFGVIALLVVVSLVQSFQINGLRKDIKNQATSTTKGAIDMSGWTENEKMMYEHHGTLPTRAQGNSQNPQAAMVGGC